jgi:hypothetical protein
VHFDDGRRLRHAHRGEVVEVALDDAPFVDGDLVGHELAEAVDDGALDLVDRVARIDDLRADVDGAPDLRYAHGVVGAHFDLRDVRDVAAVAELERHAQAGTLRQRRLAPGRLLADELEDAARPFRVEVVVVELAGVPRPAQQIDSELERILAGRMRQLVDERLEDEAEGVAARGAQRERRHAERHRARHEGEVGHEARRELAGSDAGLGGERLLRILAGEADEVITPGDQPS